MLNLRIVAPRDRADAVLARLALEESVTNVVHLPGVARKPRGDLILCDIAREEASVLIEELCALGLEEHGSIVLESVDTAIGDAARHAVEAASGAPADAVVWEQVTHATSEEAELSVSFVLFMVIATLIAAAGIMTDSPILIIGAMVVGPEFGPLAGLCVALVQRRRWLAWRSLRALAVGFPVAMTAASLGTLVVDAFDALPGSIAVADRPLTGFISEPDWLTLVVAMLAGTAGMLSLTSAKSGALIGVLISVTTIPAAADVGVAAALREWAQWWGALVQLTLNLAAIVGAGLTTLTIQHLNARRRARARARRPPAPPPEG